MPNWVSNTLTVSFTANEGNNFSNPEMTEFMSLVGKEVPQGWTENEKGEQVELRYDDNGGFSFLAYFAPPADKIEAYFGKRGVIDGEVVGDTDENWYNWNITNFGCKWDCSDVYVYTDKDENTSFFQVQFQTPWSPPEEFFRNLMNRFPSLEMSLNWEEEQGFGAEWSASDPDEDNERSITIDDEWDIPACHTDYVNRDRIDSCICAWESDPNEWFDDCEDKAEEILRWNKENGILDPNAEEPNLVY